MSNLGREACTTGCKTFLEGTSSRERSTAACAASRSKPVAAAEPHAGPVRRGPSVTNQFDDVSEGPRPRPLPKPRAIPPSDSVEPLTSQPPVPPSRSHPAAAAQDRAGSVHQRPSGNDRFDVSDGLRPRPKPKRKPDPRYIPLSDSDEPLESYGDGTGRQPDEYPVEELSIADISAAMSLTAIQEDADHSSQVGNPLIVVQLTNTISRVVVLMNRAILTLERSSNPEVRRVTIRS